MSLNSGGKLDYSLQESTYKHIHTQGHRSWTAHMEVRSRVSVLNMARGKYLFTTCFITGQDALVFFFPMDSESPRYRELKHMAMGLGRKLMKKLRYRELKQVVVGLRKKPVLSL